MLNYFFKSVSYVLHPLLMPLLAALCFFSKQYNSYGYNVTYWLCVLGGLTFIVPVFIYGILKRMNMVSDIHLKKRTERVWPLILNSIIIGYISVFIITKDPFLELHYYFIGLLITILICLIGVGFRIKASIHMMTLAATLCFIFLMNYKWENRDINMFVFGIIGIGFTASSRLHLKAHNGIELILGFVIGLIPQWVLSYCWL